MKEKILVFIPMYNCEKQICRVLDQLDGEILKYISKVIVVNNRSTDQGEERVKQYIEGKDSQISIELLRNKENYGLGGSHKIAFQYAAEHDYDYVIVLHGDDQGRIRDFLPLLEKRIYRKYDCCLGARFMKGARLTGYDRKRIIGNYVFNWLFSLCVGRKIYDLGSGLNMYKVAALKPERYLKYPDTLYFNDLMILASCYYKQKMLFYPISWREEDQVSNNKLLSFSTSLIKMLFQYCFHKKRFIESEMRKKVIGQYEATKVAGIDKEEN